MTDRGRSHKTIRRLRKSYIVRFARAYRKAPIVIRLQVGLVILVGFFLSIAAIIGAVSLFSGRSDDASMRSSSGSGTDVTETTTGIPLKRYVADVNDRVRGYEELIAAYSREYRIYKYRELILAMIQQESDGIEPDIMQAEESPYNHYPPIADAEESVLCGVQELRDCLRMAEVRGPSDIERIKLAIQGYNYGQGYIRMMKRNGDSYSPESAAEFSRMMKEKLGVDVYGDPEYVPHVLRYYVPTDKKIKSGHTDE